MKNIVQRAYDHFPDKKDKIAFIFENQHLSFTESLSAIEIIRQQLADFKIKSANKALVLAPLSTELVFLLLALLASKITPILIDPRLSRSLWKHSILLSKPDYIFSTPTIVNAHWLLPWTWRFSFISIGSKALCNHHLSFNFQNLNLTHSLITLPDTNPQEPILFSLTSGSTGLPKLISRNFSVLESQQRLSCKYLPPLENDIHLSLYGLGILQSFIHGSTTLIAPNTNIDQLFFLINKHQVTRLSIQPGKLHELIQYLDQHSKKLLSLKCILTGGAPIPFWLRKKIRDYFPVCDIYIVYGSNECEPISKLNITRTHEEPNMIGYPVGHVIDEISVTKKLLWTINGQEIYEVFFKGENTVTNTVDGQLALGDLASFDKDDNLWLLGRTTDIVNGLPAAIFEEPLERIDGVQRVLALETENKINLFIQAAENSNWSQIKTAVDDWLNKLNKDHNLSSYSIYRVPKLPVDPRHLWKIQRHHVSTLLNHYTRDKIN